MSVIGILLIIIVLVCLMALIYISKKRKALEDSFVTITTISSVNEEKSIAANDLKEEKNSAVTQSIIYEFKGNSVTQRICPFCDGENNISTKNCIICGRNLS